MEDGKRPHLELSAQATLGEESAQRALYDGATVASRSSQHKSHPAMSIGGGGIAQEKIKPLRPRRRVALLEIDSANTLQELL
jgi:hypothetical protein